MRYEILKRRYPDTKYPNLVAAAPHFPIAYFAHIEQELLEEVLKGNESLTALEAFNVCKYTGIPFGVLFNHKAILLTRDNLHHQKMMNQLNEYLYKIWDWEKRESKYAGIYMRYDRADYVNMDLAFWGHREVPYCEYLGIKHEMENALLFIKCEQEKKNNKPRGLKETA